MWHCGLLNKCTHEKCQMSTPCSPFGRNWAFVSFPCWLLAYSGNLFAVPNLQDPSIGKQAVAWCLTCWNYNWNNKQKSNSDATMVAIIQWFFSNFIGSLVIMKRVNVESIVVIARHLWNWLLQLLWGTWALLGYTWFVWHQLQFDK